MSPVSGAEPDGTGVDGAEPDGTGVDGAGADGAGVVEPGAPTPGDGPAVGPGVAEAGAAEQHAQSRAVEPSDAPEPRLPGLRAARPAMLGIHRTLGASHTAVFLFDAAGGVLHLIDQAVPAPPIDDFWARIFIDENLPLTEAVRTGRPTDGGFGSVDTAVRRYGGFSGTATGLGRVMCFPLIAPGGRAIGVLFADGCSPLTEIGDVERLEQRIAPELGVLAEELDAFTETLLTRITESAYGLRKIGDGGADAYPDAPDAVFIRAAISCGTFWWRLRESVLHLDPVAMGAVGRDGERGYTGSPVPLLARIHRDDYPLVRRTMARALAEEGVFALEYRAHTRGGSLHWIEARGRVIKDEQGEPVMVGILTDTTGSPSWTQLASTQIDAMPDGFAVLDPHRRLVYANEAVARLFGLGRAELVG
ncbi:MAG TPA: PAS domain-containing protein, partial [Actinospica sp.]|nr:PAS domain-containing protein [Actinospica sp.]